jgi:hypothetical protein
MRSDENMSILTEEMRRVVLVRVERAVAVVSLVSTTGATEEEVCQCWSAY